MAVKKVAILSPGDMGHAVGRALAEHGIEILTSLAGRSERTQTLARAAGFKEVPTLEDVVSEADLVLSILVPSHAETFARELAAALKNTGAAPYIADCNAISPIRSAMIEVLIDSAGGKFIDGSIIGGPPGPGVPPRFYVSGIHAQAMLPLDGKGIAVKSLGETTGRASGIKMCYAALTKGTSTLQVALLTVAGQGVTPHFHLGAAAVYRLLEATPFADESPETIDPDRTLSQTIQAAAAQIPAEPRGEDPGEEASA